MRFDGFFVCLLVEDALDDYSSLSTMSSVSDVNKLTICTELLQKRLSRVKHSTKTGLHCGSSVQVCNLCKDFYRYNARDKLLYTRGCERATAVQQLRLTACEMCGMRPEFVGRGRGFEAHGHLMSVVLREASQKASANVCAVHRVLQLLHDRMPGGNVPFDELNSLLRSLAMSMRLTHLTDGRSRDAITDLGIRMHYHAVVKAIDRQLGNVWQGSIGGLIAKCREFSNIPDFVFDNEEVWNQIADYPLPPLKGTSNHKMRVGAHLFFPKILAWEHDSFSDMYCVRAVKWQLVISASMGSVWARAHLVNYWRGNDDFTDVTDALFAEFDSFLEDESVDIRIRGIAQTIVDPMNNALLSLWTTSLLSVDQLPTDALSKCAAFRSAQVTDSESDKKLIEDNDFYCDSLSYGDAIQDTDDNAKLVALAMRGFHSATVALVERDAGHIHMKYFEDACKFPVVAAWRRLISLHIDEILEKKNVINELTLASLVTTLNDQGIADGVLMFLNRFGAHDLRDVDEPHNCFVYDPRCTVCGNEDQFMTRSKLVSRLLLDVMEKGIDVITPDKECYLL